MTNDTRCSQYKGAVTTSTAYVLDIIITVSLNSNPEEFLFHTITPEPNTRESDTETVVPNYAELRNNT
jgi:hypothetical protein